MLPNTRGGDGFFKDSDYKTMGMDSSNLYVVYLSFQFILGAPGIIGAAVAAFYLKNAHVCERLETLGSNSLSAVYLSIAFLYIAFTLINANLGTARRPTRVNVPDQHAYRVYGGAGDGGNVFMNDEGALGSFNRAQRALANFEEILPFVIVMTVASSYVFPWTSFAMVVILGACRVKGAIDYTDDRMKRMTGNMVATAMLANLFTMCICIGVFSLMK